MSIWPHLLKQYSSTRPSGGGPNPYLQFCLVGICFPAGISHVQAPSFYHRANQVNIWCNACNRPSTEQYQCRTVCFIPASIVGTWNWSKTSTTGGDLIHQRGCNILLLLNIGTSCWDGYCSNALLRSGAAEHTFFARAFIWLDLSLYMKRMSSFSAFVPIDCQGYWDQNEEWSSPETVHLGPWHTGDDNDDDHNNNDNNGDYSYSATVMESF